MNSYSISIEVRDTFLFRIKIMWKRLLKRKGSNGLVIKKWGNEVPKTQIYCNSCSKFAVSFDHEGINQVNRHVKSERSVLSYLKQDSVQHIQYFKKRKRQSFFMKILRSIVFTGRNSLDIKACWGKFFPYILWGRKHFFHVHVSK